MFRKKRKVIFSKIEKKWRIIWAKTQKKSRKVEQTLKYKHLLKELKTDLHMFKYHLKRALTQFSAFKQASLKVKNNTDLVTIHINWSENAKLRQAQEEMGAYFQKHQVSIYAIYSWEHDKEQPHAALSNCTSHNVPAAFASTEPTLIGFVNSGIKRINILSDSPSSQYFNKSIFWDLKEFSEKHNTSLKSI